MKYQVKTEKEFIEEFGPDWRSELGPVWVHSMDCLFNKIIDVIDTTMTVRDFGKGPTTVYTTLVDETYGNCFISMKMLKIPEEYPINGKYFHRRHIA